jgi:hypothetical protein
VSDVVCGKEGAELLQERIMLICIKICYNKFKISVLDARNDSLKLQLLFPLPTVEEKSHGTKTDQSAKFSRRPILVS